MPHVRSTTETGAAASRLDRLVMLASGKVAAGEPVDLDDLTRDDPQCREQLEMLLPTLEAMADLGHALDAPNLQPPASGLQPSPPSRILGDFRIIREIGRGGMGVVYEAEQISLGRRVALKVLPFAAMLDKQQLKRFKNEARAAATLDHSNIVAVYSVGEERGVHYYAMQLVEGESLAQVIERLRNADGGMRNEDSDALRPAPATFSRDAQVRRSGARPADQSQNSDGGSRRSEIRGQVTGVRGQETEDSGRETGDGNQQQAAADALPIEYRASSIQHPASRPAADIPTAARALTTLPDRNSREYFRTIARLGIQAAEALDHAHASGILHRDIKPGNLLVECSHHAPRDETNFRARRATEDHHAERDDYTLKLWITDFGLARLESDASMTMTGDLLGTLRYMSPEQALGQRAVVDHRSDVYSLGVTLYELLTLQPAYPAQDRQELLRHIAFEEPAAPRKLRPHIPADLETIVLKAMSKSPAQRYATAQELAHDLRRFTTDQPIKARPPTRRDQAVKWARRHPAAVWAAACFLLAATLVSAGSAVLLNGAYQRETAEREQAEESERQATLHAGRVAKTLEFLTSAFHSKVDQGGRDVTLKQVLDRAAGMLRGGYTDDPELKAMLLREVAKSYARAGLPLDAIPLYEQLRELQQAAAGPNDPQTIATSIDLATSYRGVGRDAEGLALLEDAYERTKANVGEEGARTVARQLAQAYQLDGHFEKSLPFYQQDLARARAAQGADVPTQEDLIVAISNLGEAYHLTGRWADAMPLLQESLGLERRLAVPNQHRMGKAMVNLGNVSIAAVQFDDAIALFEEAVPLINAALGPDHPDAIVAKNGLGRALMSAGRHAEAVQVFEEIVEFSSARFGHDHSLTLKAKQGLAFAYAQSGEFEKSLALCEECFTLAKAKWGADYLKVDDGLLAMTRLGNAYLALRRWNDALPLFEQSLAIGRQREGPHDPRTMATMCDLASVYFHAGRMDDALALFEETLRLQKKKLSPGNRDTIRTMACYAEALAGNGNPEASARLLEEAIAICGHKPGDAMTVLGLRHNLAHSLFQSGEAGKAISLLEESLLLPIAKQRPEDHYVIETMCALTWMLASPKAGALRDGQRAVEFAKKVHKQTDPPTAERLAFLAKAHLACGELEAADEWL